MPNIYLTKIRRGTGQRKHIVYAHLRDQMGGLVVSATLDYILLAIAEGWHSCCNLPEALLENYDVIAGGR